MRRGASSAPAHQHQSQYFGAKRTCDDVVSSGGTQQLGVPQSSMIVSTPSQT